MEMFFLLYLVCLQLQLCTCHHGGGVHLQRMSKACLGNTLEMVCWYPNVTQRDDHGQRIYARRAQWIRKGTVLYPDGRMYTTTNINETTEILRVDTRLIPESEFGSEIKCCLVYIGTLGNHVPSNPLELPNKPQPKFNISFASGVHGTVTAIFRLNNTNVCYNFMIALFELNNNVKYYQKTITLPANKTFTNITGLKPEQDYYYEIVAVSQNANLNYSSSTGRVFSTIETFTTASISTIETFSTDSNKREFQDDHVFVIVGVVIVVTVAVLMLSLIIICICCFICYKQNIHRVKDDTLNCKEGGKPKPPVLNEGSSCQEI